MSLSLECCKCKKPIHYITFLNNGGLCDTCQEELHPTTKIYCHTCHGEGFIYEDQYPDYKRVKIICPECKGQKFLIRSRSIDVNQHENKQY